MKRRSVLLVGDDPATIEMMAGGLSAEYTIQTATDALDGYALLCQQRTDLVVLDAMMPMVDGWTMLRKIRSNPALSRVRVIVMTGLERESANDDTTRLGVDHVLVKPVSPLQLMKTIRAALGDMD